LIRLARCIVVALAATLLAPTLAVAHIERPSYWPDPAPDTSVSPPAGGAVPAIRSLYSALDKAPPGDTRVVCQGSVPSRKALTSAERRLRSAVKRKLSRRTRIALRRIVVKRQRAYARAIGANPSIQRLDAAIADARAKGYKYRPSMAALTLSKVEATRLRRFNERLLAACRFDAIQAAVTASHNNDRVVVMPGVYTEPASRAKPKNDPACLKYLGHSDYPQRPGAATYKYHFNCPNDANLIAVMGREPGTVAPPDPPLYDRHGIPDVGPCIRCNFQIEGSGVTGGETVIEAGNAAAGNGGPSGAGASKDVGIAAERADGFVLTNMTVRHAKEHNIYVIESDGYMLDRFKTYYPGLYGTLTFVEDHGVQQNCDAVGGGDSGIYPGAPAETGEQRAAGTQFRYNQEIRFCDSHHNEAGYSATNGNAVWIHDNEFYGNALGLQTDIATAAGHPGFPDDSMLIEHNNFRSNNFNPYDAGSDVKPAFPYPVGTGMWIAGGNNHTVRENHFWDNWRRGAMLFAIPDALVCGPTDDNVQKGCDASQTHTSHRNRFYKNVMGAAPDGTKAPNGTDFWWDSFPGNTANCWYGNTGPKPITSSPASLPNCAGGTDPSTSLGTGEAANEGELLTCFVSFTSGDQSQGQSCPWFTTPSKPAASARADQSTAQRARYRAVFLGFCRDGRPAATCGPWRSLLARL
jgi:hypothetical protein